ncbi:radical SAM protein [Thermodesulfobacteriota bacterium]
MDSPFDVDAPWRVGKETSITLLLHDEALVGSSEHFLRFDFYPLHAPSHPERHMAYWDIPLEAIISRRTTIVLNAGTMTVGGAESPQHFEPTWKGPMEFSGYCRMNVSLWYRAAVDLRKIDMQTSEHLALEDDRDLPLETMLVSVSQRCNLLCPHCTRQQGARLDPTDVDEAVLEGVFEAAHRLVYIGLQGIGEPLMNPNLLRITDTIRKRMPTVGRLAVTTNGTLLTKKASAGLIDAGLNSITFSIDAATKAVYEIVRVGGDFERLIANITEAIEYGKSTGRQNLWFGANFIVMDTNAHEIPALVELGAALGLDSISFYWARKYPPQKLAIPDSPSLELLLDEAKRLGRKYGINLRIANNRYSRNNICFFTQGVYLWLTGEVLPCHQMEPPGHPWPVRIFGNLRDNSLIDIWNKPEYRKHRREVRRGHLPETCAGCNHCSSVTTL